MVVVEIILSWGQAGEKTGEGEKVEEEDEEGKAEEELLSVQGTACPRSRVQFFKFIYTHYIEMD